VKILLNKKQHDMDLGQLLSQIDGYSSIHIDVGTGRGKLVLNSAKKNLNHFFIGLDPSAESMYENSIRAAKQGKKQMVANALFVVSSIESPPNELVGIADTLSVILPWGSLRDGIVKADPRVIGNLRALGKLGSTLSVLVGYDEGLEPHEMGKRKLPVLSESYFQTIIPTFCENGILLRHVKTIGNSDLKQIDSDWAKRLAYGVPRKMYKLNCLFI